MRCQVNSTVFSWTVFRAGWCGGRMRRFRRVVATAAVESFSRFRVVARPGTEQIASGGRWTSDEHNRHHH